MKQCPPPLVIPMIWNHLVDTAHTNAFCIIFLTDYSTRYLLFEFAEIKLEVPLQVLRMLSSWKIGSIIESLKAKFRQLIKIYPYSSFPIWRSSNRKELIWIKTIENSNNNNNNNNSNNNKYAENSG